MKLTLSEKIEYYTLLTVPFVFAIGIMTLVSSLLGMFD